MFSLLGVLLHGYNCTNFQETLQGSPMLGGVDFLCKGSKPCVKSIKPIQVSHSFSFTWDTLQPRGVELKNSS